MRLLPFFCLLIACSHSYATTTTTTTNTNTKTKTNARHDYQWDKEQKSIANAKKEMETLSHWAKEYVGEHAKKLQKHTLAIKAYEKKLEQSENNALAAKKLKLEQGREENKMIEQHHHFLEDHKKIAKIMSQLKALKAEMESHEDHHH